MSFEEDFKSYLKRLKKMAVQLPDLTEESTKTALIMPFFSMLGYDVFDASEFMPEFTCDVATKKGEKVDYAILKDGEPVILIEAKRAGMKLQKQQQGQLYRYFSVNRCRIAVLTNGITYQFFSDLNAPNIMDDEPFLSFNLLEDDPALYTSAVSQFCKDKFNIKNVISKAVFQKYSKVVQKTLKEDMIFPSDELVKYFLSRPEVKTGSRITSQMIEKYREATAEAMQKIFNLSAEEFQTDINPVSQDAEMTETPVVLPEPKNPVTLETISETIQKIGQNEIPDFRCQTEDTPDFYKIHIHTTNSRKMGVVKISKSDLSIQFRELGNGAPIVHELQSAEEFRSLVEGESA
ncbi:MAG: type I restriction enzyme HsdR N-terminal domain-containing protein [Oscillospiraceae bacterium]|nr:type I restriction enzyme HsdR N-terminal domain-containing protein [Oscillospiraceae bacterium]